MPSRTLDSHLRGQTDVLELFGAKHHDDDQQHDSQCHMEKCPWKYLLTNAVHLVGTCDESWFHYPAITCLALSPRTQAAQHMHVQMENFLPSLCPVLITNAKPAVRIGPAALLQRQAGARAIMRPEQSPACSGCTWAWRDVQLGHHQEMHGRPGVDVVEAKISSSSYTLRDGIWP